MATTTAITVKKVPDNLVRYAWAVVAYNILVILWGALVRATGSGAGCGNHWPLCNGQVVPLAPRIDTIIEFTHRCMTGGSTFAVAGLGYVTGNQSVGRVVMLSIHLSNTLLLLGALTLTAVVLHTGQSTRELRLRGTKAAWTIAGLAATIVVGVSGSLAALGDTLFPASSLRAAFEQDISSSSPLLLRLRGIHPLSAVIAAVFVVWIVREARRAGAHRLATAVLALLGAQFLLGLVDVALLAPTWMQILHLLGADLYWTALVALAAKTVWPPSLRNV